jgi:hypothetical protein
LSTSEHDHFDPMAALSFLTNVECPTCGRNVPRSSTSCEHCGAEIDQSEDVNISMIAGQDSIRPRVAKTSLSEARSLKRLKKAYDGLIEQTLTEAQYKREVARVLLDVQGAIAFYRTPEMQRRVAGMEEGPANLFVQLAKHTEEMQRGLESMISYTGTQGISVVEQGLRQVEAALKKIDSDQDVAQQNID